MSKDISELRKKLERLKSQLPIELPKMAKEFAMTVKADAERKIKDKGFGKVYSETLVPSYWFYDKELNAKGKTFLEGLIPVEDEEGDKVYLTNWKEFREAQGLQTKFVDLSYSNEMWRGLFPSEPYVINEQYFSELAHTNTEGQDKMNYNRERYGEFILKSADMEKISLLFQKRFANKVKEILNS